MAKNKIHKVGELTEGKKQIISQLLDEYDIESAEDIQDALADLLGGTIKGMMEAEMPSLRWGRPWTNISVMKRTKDLTVRMRGTDTRARRSKVTTVNSILMSLRIVTVLSSLRSCLSGRKISHRSTRR